MKAAYIHGKGKITTGESILQPPGPDEVRIDVAYCGICGTDVHIFEGAPISSRVATPEVIGHEMSGEIVEIGSNVEGWSVGDRVVVRPIVPCGTCYACRAGYSHICYNLKFLGIDGPGAFQRSWTVPSHTLHRLPGNIPLDVAALIEPLAIAYHAVRRGEVEAGHDIVVIGGGPIGLLIGLVARHIGARVLISGTNPFRASLAREIGMDTVDPKEQNLVELVASWTDGAGASVVFEASGTTAGAAVMTQLARARGCVVVVGIPSVLPEVDLAYVMIRELHIHGARTYDREDYERSIQLVASQAFPIEKLISATWPVSELTSAIEHMLAKRDLMKVLIDTREE